MADKFRVHHNVQFPRRIVLSEKAQFWLKYGGHITYLDEIAKLRNEYLQARTVENIDKISTLEMEQIVSNGMSIGTYIEARAENNKKRKK